MEKSKIVEILQPYFEDEKRNVTSLILCDDGNVFYDDKPSKGFCKAHCKQNNTKSNVITKANYIQLKKDISPVKKPVVKEAAQKTDTAKPTVDVDEKKTVTGEK